MKFARSLSGSERRLLESALAAADRPRLQCGVNLYAFGSSLGGADSCSSSSRSASSLRARRVSRQRQDRGNGARSGILSTLLRGSKSISRLIHPSPLPSFLPLSLPAIWGRGGGVKSAARLGHRGCRGGLRQTSSSPPSLSLSLRSPGLPDVKKVAETSRVSRLGSAIPDRTVSSGRTAARGDARAITPRAPLRLSLFAGER